MTTRSIVTPEPAQRQIARDCDDGQGRAWNVKEVLQWTSAYFQRGGMASPRLDAEVLLAHVLGCDRVRLYLDHDRPLSTDERSAYRELVRRRAAGEPAAYLLGEKEFYGRAFLVDSRVLVPRPETEHIVDSALEALDAWGIEDSVVLDLGTGSGCIAVSIAAERPGVEVVAVDLSAGAIDLARANAERLGVSSRVIILEGDLFEPVEQNSLGPFSLIVSNPPYIATREIQGLMKDVRDHEPRAALDAGPSGMEILARIIREAPAHALPGATLILEHAEGQGEALLELTRADHRYSGAIDLRDHAGLDRALVAKIRADGEIT